MQWNNTLYVLIKIMIYIKYVQSINHESKHESVLLLSIVYCIALI